VRPALPDNRNLFAADITALSVLPASLTDAFFFTVLSGATPLFRRPHTEGSLPLYEFQAPFEICHRFIPTVILPNSPFSYPQFFRHRLFLRSTSCPVCLFALICYVISHRHKRLPPPFCAWIWNTETPFFAVFIVSTVPPGPLGPPSPPLSNRVVVMTKCRFPYL